MTSLAVNKLIIGANGQVTNSSHYFEFDLFLQNLAHFWHLMIISLMKTSY